MRQKTKEEIDQSDVWLDDKEYNNSDIESIALEAGEDPSERKRRKKRRKIGRRQGKNKLRWLKGVNLNKSERKRRMRKTET